jgi:hypothetical protein
MADFRTKLIMLAGAAALCAGTAFGQASLGVQGINTVNGATFIRAEGTTEQLTPTTVVVNNPTPSNVSVSLTVYLSPALTITSQTVNKLSETTATPAGGTAVNGSVAGSTVAFNGVQIPANSSTLVTIANIRVNASTIVVGTGIPTAVTETVFLAGATGTVTPGAVGPTNVAFATNGLQTAGANAVSSSVVNTGQICTGFSTPTIGFTVSFAEAFVGAFKTLAGEALGSAAPATSGTRIALTFNNVPSAVSVYLPLTVNANGIGLAQGQTAPNVPFTGSLTLVASATAASAGNAVSDSKVKGESVPLGLVATANGTGTAYYEIYGSNPAALDSYTPSVYLVNAAGTLAAPTSPITVTVSLAPSVATGTAPTQVPTFVGATSAQTVNGSTFTACTTTLLFPFVTNQAGFETGIAISNTGLDALGSKGTSSVTGQSGTCSLTFFGNATAASNPAAYTTPASIPTGTTWTATLTSVTGGTPNTFGGYMIANCNFLYAHGFSYITYNIGQPSGMAMGYLALELGTRPVGVAFESLNN